MSDTNQSPQPIINLILADINAVIPNFSSLVASYRLLVGASEEIHRTPEVCPEVFERAVRRADNAGTLIDVFMELLYCKIAFSSEFLKISCAPVDLFRLLANRNTATDIPFHTAEQVVEMEVLRRILERCQNQNSCLPEHPVVCPETAPTPAQVEKISDIQEVEAALLTQLQTIVGSIRELSPEHTVVCPEPTGPPPSLHVPEKPSNIHKRDAVPLTKPQSQSQLTSTEESPIESRVRRKHLKDAYNPPSKSNRR
ncbi:MAG: hypothetical protein H6Q68_3236 [Firmicutes bacterium]|nr:hypothetical protein [Bacillota bacterium]